MGIHPLFRPRRVIALLGMTFGAGLGIALSHSPVAAADADAIDDAWPYLTPSPEFSYPYYSAAVLPGYPGPLTAPAPDVNDVTYVHQPDPLGFPVADEWYTVHTTFSTVPIFGGESQSVVTAVLDGSAFPHVGTVADGFAIFPFIPVSLDATGLEPLFTNSYLDDPALGFADAFTVQGFFGPDVGITDTYISDAAGVKDVLSAYGLPTVTLFEFPAADPGAGASDLGQLMTEFSTLF
jgi:hypothetical protein